VTTEQVVRNAYEAFQTGDMQRMAGYLDERVVWHVPGRSAVAGDKLGRDSTLSFFGELAARSQGTMQVQLERVLADDGYAIAQHHTTAQRGEATYTAPEMIAFQAENGTITEAWVYCFDQHGFDTIFQ
jgi:uncharacterized protein